MKPKFNFLLLAAFVLVFFSLSFLFAYPGIPHKFYGTVEVNGAPAPDNNIITAAIGNQIYTTVTVGGNYGIAPTTFYVEDPNYDNAGKTITFYVGGKEAATYSFENSGYTKLDFALTTECGDAFCLGDETCGSCPGDCGICTEPPKIMVASPTEKIYNTTKIDLDVSSDQPIIIWMYSLDSAGFVTFAPNITLTIGEGVHDLTVLGINQQFQSASNEVSFEVDLPEPYCGDGFCNAEETCASCSQDCGVCSGGGSSSSSSGGGGGGSSSSSSGGGGGGAVTTTNETQNISDEGTEVPLDCTEDWTCSDWLDCVGGIEKRVCTDNSNCGTQIDKPAEVRDCNVEDSEDSWITGAAVFFRENITKTQTIIGIAILVVIIIGIAIFSMSRKRKRSKE